MKPFKHGEMIMSPRFGLQQFPVVVGNRALPYFMHPHLGAVDAIKNGAFRATEQNIKAFKKSIENTNIKKHDLVYEIKSNTKIIRVVGSNIDEHLQVDWNSITPKGASVFEEDVIHNTLCYTNVTQENMDLLSTLYEGYIPGYNSWRQKIANKISDNENYAMPCYIKDGKKLNRVFIIGYDDDQDKFYCVKLKLYHDVYPLYADEMILMDEFR